MYIALEYGVAFEAVNIDCRVERVLVVVPRLLICCCNTIENAKPAHIAAFRVPHILNGTFEAG
jgi:hypothetical protein